MTERCALCETPHPELTDDAATVYNDSGGIPTAVCADCRDKLLQPRCSVCGLRCSGDRFIAVRSINSAEPDTAPLCGPCRREILFGDGGEIQ